MVIPSAESVVLLPFPFSDLTQSKLRPAVVLAAAERGDWVLCQITSKTYGDARAEQLTSGDFSDWRVTAGELRPTRKALCRAWKSLHGRGWTAYPVTFQRVREAARNIFK